MDFSALKPGDYVLIKDDSGFVEVGIFLRVSARKVTLDRDKARGPVDGVHFSWRQLVDREDVIAGPITTAQFRRVAEASRVLFKQVHALQLDLNDHIRQLRQTFNESIPKLLEG